MQVPRALPVALVALLVWPSMASAQGAYLSFEDSVNVGAIKWGAVALAVLVVVAIIRYQLVRYLQKRRGIETGHEPQVSPEDDFRARAQELGFRGAEYRNLKRIATRLAPKTPGALLVSTAGREYLVADLRRRSLRREREVSVLQGIRDRLNQLGDQPVHEREVVRLDAHLAVWVEPRRTAPPPGPASQAAPKVASAPDTRHQGSSAQGPAPGAPPSQDSPEPAGEAEAPTEAEADASTGFEDLASVQGRLVDLGLGGCAVEVELETSLGQIVELWSADWEVHLPRISGDVVSVEPPEGDRASIIHLRFLDPNEDELEMAMEDIRDRDEAVARRREEGDSPGEVEGYDPLGEFGE